MNERFREQSNSPRFERVSQALCELESSYIHKMEPQRAIAYPTHAEIRHLPGGTMVEMTPEQRCDHLCRLAEDGVYMKERFAEEEALLGTINKFIITEPSSPYSGQHVTIFREPAGQGESGRVFDNLTGLDPKEQAEFIDINLKIRDQLIEKFPDQQFVIGINRSARPHMKKSVGEEPRLIVGSQSVPILHSHIVNRRVVSEERSFAEVYNPDVPSEDTINSKLLALRTTHVTSRLQHTLQEYFGQYSQLEVIENTGKFIDVRLSSNRTEMTHQISLAVGIAEDVFEELEWGKVYDTLPEVLQGDINFGYSWAITPDNNLRIGFTPHNTGSLELFDVVLDRSLKSTPAEMQQARQTTREAVTEMLPSLQQH